MGVIEASIPLFFLLIAAELGVAWVRRDRVYRLNDSLSDLSCGVVSQLTGIFTKVLVLGAYAWVFTHARWQLFLPVPEFASGPLWADGAIQWGPALTWSAAFVLGDLAYYWMHRLSHEVNVLWAGHVVHHSSEEYNLTVALRQSSLHGIFTWVFYVPIAFVGVPWEPFAVTYALNLIYQFWIHTREIRTLGAPIEAVLNTPSHHRVHHGVNPEYQDKNYAGVLIIWDRLFGTFEPERAAPVYGITTPLATWNVVTANVHVFREIVQDTWRAPSLADKWRIVFGRPGWKPAALGPSVVPKPVSAETFHKFDPPVATAVRWYVFVQFVVVLVASILLLKLSSTLATVHTAVGVFYVTVTLANLGGLLEGQQWSATTEYARVVAVGAASASLLFVPSPLLTAGVATGVVLYAVLSTGWLTLIRKHLTAKPQIAPALLM